MTDLVKRPNTGSEKQQDWANMIKANKIMDAENMISQPGVSEANKKMVRELIDKMNDIIDSIYWINNRDKIARDIMKQIRDNQ